LLFLWKNFFIITVNFCVVNKNAYFDYANIKKIKKLLKNILQNIKTYNIITKQRRQQK